MKKTYHYRQSHVFDGAKRPDDKMPVKKIRTSKGEDAARKKLPRPEMGRDWILVNTTD